VRGGFWGRLGIGEVGDVFMWLVVYGFMILFFLSSVLKLGFVIAHCKQ